MIAQMVMTDYLPHILKCVRCGKCRIYCPVHEELKWESTSARGRVLCIRALCDGIKPTERMLQSFGTCVTCGMCTENCPSGAKADELVEVARAELVDSGYLSKEHRLLSDRVNECGNVLGEDGERLNWVPDYTPVDSADEVFFAGCMECYRFPETAADTYEILRRFGVALLPDERCCGSPLLRTGQIADAKKLIKHNIEQIHGLGARKVIVGCAGCYTTLKNDYLKYADDGIDFEVVHVSEYIVDRLDELEPHRLDLTVSYHDPCHIGRSHGIYEAPRRIIERVCELVEMEHIKSDARCCGGGGGVRIAYNDLSMALARKRLHDSPEDVDYIATPCPLCERNLRDAGGKTINLMTLLRNAL